jgi:channel protein (hemolysin III family)
MDSGTAEVAELYRLYGFSEPFSAISHLLGTVAFLILGVMLLRRGRGDRARMIYLGVYAGSCVLLMSMSTVYHMVPRGSAAHVVMERLDHAAIFVLIAGTFTPILGMLFQGWLRWSQLILIWAAAITGIILKTIFFNDVDEWLGLSFYLGLGWVGCFSAALLARRYGFAFIKPLLWGGLAYSIGGVFDFARWPTVVPRVVGGHEVFHVTVIIGAVFHWWFIWQFADGAPVGEGLGRRREAVHAAADQQQASDHGRDRRLIAR